VCAGVVSRGCRGWTKLEQYSLAADNILVAMIMRNYNFDDQYLFKTKICIHRNIRLNIHHPQLTVSASFHLPYDIVHNIKFHCCGFFFVTYKLLLESYH